MEWISSMGFFSASFRVGKWLADKKFRPDEPEYILLVETARRIHLMHDLATNFGHEEHIETLKAGLTDFEDGWEEYKDVPALIEKHFGKDSEEYEWAVEGVAAFEMAKLLFAELKEIIPVIERFVGYMQDCPHHKPN